MKAPKRNAGEWYNTVLPNQSLGCTKYRMSVNGELIISGNECVKALSFDILEGCEEGSEPERVSRQRESPPSEHAMNNELSEVAMPTLPHVLSGLPACLLSGSGLVAHQQVQQPQIG